MKKKNLECWKCKIPMEPHRVKTPEGVEFTSHRCLKCGEEITTMKELDKLSKLKTKFIIPVPEESLKRQIGSMLDKGIKVVVDEEKNKVVDVIFPKGTRNRKQLKVQAIRLYHILHQSG